MRFSRKNDILKNPLIWRKIKKLHLNFRGVKNFTHQFKRLSVRMSELCNIILRNLSAGFSALPIALQVSYIRNDKSKNL